MTAPLYIFDLDGTLALIDHRRHFVEGPSPDWTAFYAACVNDKPNQPVLAVMRALYVLGAEVWVFSGRSDEVRDETIDWLRYYSIIPRSELEGAYLQMRPQGDYTPDDQLKRSWLHAMLPEDRARLVAVFDDRKKVVDMWRSEGVACFQVAEGDF